MFAGLGKEQSTSEASAAPMTPMTARPPDPGGGPGGVGLARVEPGDDRLDGHRRRKLRRPPSQSVI
jgi:hypothetical protein